jgi:hypothetical protein
MEWDAPGIDYRIIRLRSERGWGLLSSYMRNVCNMLLSQVLTRVFYKLAFG